MPILPPTPDSPTPISQTPTPGPTSPSPSFSPAPQATAFTPAPTKLTPPPGGKGGFPKIFIIAVLVLLAVLALFFIIRLLTKSSKSTGGKKGSKEITLTYWGLWEPENVMAGIISDYQSSHPNIKIQYIRKDKNDYRERLISNLSGGEGPDIFRFHNSWVPMFKSILSPLPKDIMTNATFEKTFYPFIQKDLNVNGNYMGVPLSIDTLLLYYNEDLLRAGGKTTPATWDELLITAQDLTVRDQEKITTSGIALGNATNVDHWPEILSLLMLQNGTDMATPGSTIGSDGKNLGAEALSYYSLFRSKYRLWDETFASSTQAFAAGKLAFYFGPSWEAFEFAKNSSLRFGVVTTPKLGDVEKHMATYWIEGVSDKSPHQKEAWDFLAFLVKKENLQKLYETQAKTRLFGEPPSRMDMADQFKNATDNPIVSAVLASAPTAVSSYLVSGTWDGQSGLNTRMMGYFADAVTAVNRNTPPEEALKTVDQGVAQIFSQYAIK